MAPTIRPASLLPQTALEPIKTLIPNPCRHGCGYDWGNCTWGVALWREAMGFPVGDNWGNAKDWLSNARTAGFEVGPTPYAGSVGINTGGYYGHAVLVEAVQDTQVYIKEMNSLGLGMVDEQWQPIGRYTYIGQ